MRLLKTKSPLPELEDFTGDDIPLYAILSHTWGRDEISFQDIQDIQRGDTTLTKKAEYSKIANTRPWPPYTDSTYVWIDTFCV